MKDKKLKIAIIGSTYARFNDDPQVPWLRETVNRLKDKGYDISVIVPSHKINYVREIDGIRVLRFRYAPRKYEILTHDEGAPNKIDSLFYKLLIFPYLIIGTLQTLYWCKKYNFDLLNIHWPIPHMVFAILPKLFFKVKSG